MKNNFEIKFWKDWLNADPLKKLELVKGLPMFKMSLKMKNSKMWKNAFAMLLNSYFEDLESAICCDIELRNNRKIKESLNVPPFRKKSATTRI